MRKRLFEIIEIAHDDDKASHVYDVLMLLVIVMSLIPLMFKRDLFAFRVIDKIAAGVFILDYLLRFATADLKIKKGGISFLIYPFTPMAIIDLVCILPSLTILNSGFRILKMFRLVRTLRVFRVFKAVRYSKSIKMIKGIFIAQKRPLITVGLLAVAYVLVSALVIFNVEPDSFETFFDAVYWATVSLTTVGYGDIYPVTTTGRLVTMVSAIFGIAIIALPAGIITAGFMEELKKVSPSPAKPSDAPQSEEIKAEPPARSEEIKAEESASLEGPKEE